MKKCIFSFFIVITCFQAFAQKQAEKWFFGSAAALDFSSGAPVEYLGSAMTMLEGVASIADSNGNTLFYTNGSQVWNANNLQMPNGSGLLGDNNSAQAAIIVPDPGSVLEYYIFTTPTNGTGAMCYSKVDMTLQAGLGDVTAKNVVVFNNSTERVTAVRHGNGVDIWVIGHEFGNNNFYSFQVSATGVNLIPVITSTGSINMGSLGFAGYMKTGHHGNKIAYANAGQGNVELFDFDKLTGIPSNPVLLNVPQAYGLEFSPDDSKLYASSENPQIVYQWDVNAGSAAAIIASQIAAGPNVGSEAYAALQLAPDGKIYLANRFSNFLGVINNPNAAGTACNFVDNAITLINSNQYGLPNYYQSYFDSTVAAVLPPQVLLISSDTTFCDKKCLDFFDLSTNSPTSWQWFFPGADSTSSNEQHPAGICYNSYGSFDVTLVACNAAGCDTLFLPGFIKEFQPPPIPVISSNADTLFSTPSYSYQWYDNNGLITGANGPYYIYQQPGSYYVIITDSNGCASSSNVIFTSVQDHETWNTMVSILPNPSDGHFEINYGYLINKIVEIKIYDATGRLVCSQTGNSDNNKMHLKISDGIYFLEAIADNNIYRSKFIIKR